MGKDQARQIMYIYLDPDLPAPTKIDFHGRNAPRSSGEDCGCRSCLYIRCPLPISGLEHGVREIRLGVYVACVAF
jgi:hypothetical protein